MKTKGEINVINVEKKTAYLNEYDVTVNKFLLPAQVQQIANAVVKFDTWAERENNIIMLVMFHATDVDEKELEEIGVNKLIESGLFEKVKYAIDNFYEIDEAIEYTESFARNMKLVLDKSAPQINDLLDLVVKRYVKTTTKK